MNDDEVKKRIFALIEAAETSQKAVKDILEKIPKEISRETANSLASIRSASNDFRSNISTTVSELVKPLQETANDVNNAFHFSRWFWQALCWICFIGTTILVLIIYNNHICNVKYDELNELRYKIDMETQNLDRIQSKTWKIELNESEGKRWIILPRGKKFGNITKMHDGRAVIFIE